jgi:hypothetical protein
MIKNGKDVTLDQAPGTLPNVSGAFRGLLQKMTIEVVTKTIEDYQNVETTEILEIRGVWQQYTSEDQDIKEDGVRSWQRRTLHTDTALNVNLDDKIIHQGVTYRVLEKGHWNDYGYYQYGVTEDWRTE